MAKLKKCLNDDNGEVMLESTLVMVVTMFLLIALISLGFLFYQQAMINTVASDLATDIASAYKLAGVESDSDGIPANAYNDIELYRTSLSISNMKASHRNNAEEKLLPERVKLTTLGISDKTPVVDSFDITVDNVGRMHVDVSVSMECDILFGGALEYFGIVKSTPKFSASGRAECLDVTAYASHVQFLDYVSSKVEGSNVDTVITKIIGIFKDTKSIKDMLFK